MDEKERYAFTAEWYDPNASFNRQYQLLFYPCDSTVEMYDIKNRRLFLKRSKCSHVQLKDLFIGAIVNIHSRQLTITGYADEFTTRKLKSAKEKTLAIIKPDCISKVGDILDRVVSEGFIICQAKMVTLSLKEAGEFYAEHAGKPFFEKLVGFMTGGPIIAFEITGVNAIAKWREILGPTDSSEARKVAPGSIRAQFGTDATRNACHGSDSEQSARREADFFFGAKSQRKNTATVTKCTLGIIKPHAVMEGLTGKIMKEIASAGFTISALMLHYMEKANTQEFYEVYKGVVSEYTSMVDELTSGPCVAMEITGENAHAKFREFCGPVDPEIARHLRPHTLRAKFGTDKIKNAVHCTDLPEDGLLEVEYFFKILDS